VTRAAGYCSASLTKSFLIVCLSCPSRRQQGEDEIVSCHDRSRCADETLKLVQMAPHGEASKEPAR